MVIDEDAALKLRRAHQLINELKDVIGNYADRSPFAVVPRLSEHEGWLDHVLLIREPVPRELGPRVGDVLHNLRSALETALFAAAFSGSDSAVSEAEQNGVSYPCLATEHEFDSFLRDRRRRRWNPHVVSVLRELQPFTDYEYLDEADRMRISPQQWRDRDLLHRLMYLNNRDKHRRLAILLWWPKLVWFMDQEGAAQMDFQFADEEPRDGSVLWRTRGRPADQTELFQEFGLALADDVLHPLSRPTNLLAECTPTLEAFAGRVEWAAFRLAQASEHPTHASIDE